MTEPEKIEVVKTELLRMMDDIVTLKFKLSNLITERDVANQEIERLETRDMWLSGLDKDNKENHQKIANLESQLAAANVEIERLNEATKQLQDGLSVRDHQLTAANARVEKLAEELKQWKECYMEKTTPYGVKP